MRSFYDTVALAGSGLNAGQSGTLMRRGQEMINLWSRGADVGFVYIGATLGSVTQIASSGIGNQLQIVGLVKSSTQIDVDPQLALVEVA